MYRPQGGPKTVTAYDCQHFQNASTSLHNFLHCPTQFPPKQCEVCFRQHYATVCGTTWRKSKGGFLIIKKTRNGFLE